MDFYSDNRHGSANWATQSQLLGGGLYQNKGIFLGLCPFTNNYLTLDSDAPSILIGGAGSGKGTTQLLYNNFYDGSMLINDPKGEIGAIIGNYQKKSGKEFYCINPTGLHTQSPWELPQHKVNPFDILKIGSLHLVSDCKRIAMMLIPTEGGKSFFIKRARQWMSNLLLAYALTSKNPTVSGFMQVLNMIENNHVDFKALALGLYATLGNDDITLTMNEIINKRSDAGASGEYSGVISTIGTAMDFMTDPQLKTLFSGADFSLDILSQTNPAAVVDIAFPAENLNIWNKALRLIIGVAILYQYRNQKSKPLFLIDEAAQLGHFEELEMSYTYGRSFYRTMAIFQDIGQIEKHYNKSGIQTFLGSSQAKTFIGIRDYETAKLVSEMLGNQTIEVENPIYAARGRHERQKAINNLLFSGGDPFQVGMELGYWNREAKHRDKIKRPLLTPDEILTMPEDRSLIFLSGLGVDPIAANRMPYFKNPNIAQYFLPNPYHV
ncbi:MAG: TraM recognition domain-containing protein [Methylomarinum sp.]|nr:TraM recognition domain-containing protein [Methylomarinum sp.]